MIDDSPTDDLAERLRGAGVDPDAWDRGDAKSLDDLRREIAAGEAVLEECDGTIRRVVSVTRVLLRRGNRTLIEARQQLRDGRIRVRETLPAEKMKPGEDAVSAARRCLREELAVDPRQAADILRVEGPLTESFDAPSYPGLRSRYFFWDVEVDVDALPEGSLPEGSFETFEQAEDDAVVNHFWEWREDSSDSSD